MNDDTFLILNKMFPCREEQITRLCRFFPENPDKKLTRHILLEGLSGSGRTAIIQKLFDIRKEFYILINCIECYTTRLLYFHLLYGLFNKLELTYEEIDSFNTVYSYYQKFENKQKLRCIILKNSYLLHLSVLEQLCELQELLIRDGWNFSLVFVSSENCTHLIELPIRLVRISFSRYNRDELIKILIKEQEEDTEMLEIFRNFLHLFLPLITPIYNDLPDVRRLVHKFFPIYRRPIKEGVLSLNQLVPLSKYLMNFVKINDFSLMYDYHEDDPNTKVRDIMDLPLCAKYLLVAAFLASYVPKKKDKMFTITSSKRKKRDGHSLKKNDENELLLGGPKPFKFSRLMFIYQAVMGERTTFNFNVISMVAALLELGLITPHGDPHRENLNEPQYKCVTNPNSVYDIAENIEIDIQKYLSSQ